MIAASSVCRLAVQRDRDASLHRLVRLRVNNGGDLGVGVQGNVVVHTCQLQVVVCGVCHSVSDVERVAADGLEDVGVIRADCGPCRGALYGAAGVADFSDLLRRCGSERGPRNEEIPVGVAEVAQVDGREGS